MKGFTLIEILGVLIILGLLALITVPVVTNILKSNTNTLRNVQIDNIETSAKEYVAENIFGLDLEEGKSCTLTIKDLKDYGSLEQNIIDPLTNENFNDNETILVENKKGDITCTLCIDNKCNLTSVSSCKD
ncbi:MAG: prepilin-type N-terminal cleavage/methylation domain-containing protein [Clostridium sp.]|nr:prepilin-type N-terminal cleavage/methylation domain-containing protein [Clostridium sp.]MCM1444656.1 prepilin-type N-terminal cleavage/methylation domain-containing protein [Candidatus Amulumruptor caecigallinarius]